MKIRKAISSILLCTVLAGCSSSGESHEIPLDQSSDCPVSTIRTGIERQGIKTYGNGFECIDAGSYFMYNNGDSWLLYADHGSDTFIKLCGRPDCNHLDKDCNAFFKSAYNICYYNDFLYTFDNDDNIIRINLDGTERTSMYNISSFMKDKGYNGEFGMRILNGIFFIDLTKVNESGSTVRDGYYYKLDGSMNEPQPVHSSSFEIVADGKTFIIPVYNKESGFYTYNIWDPDKGVGDELFKAEERLLRGYIGTKAEYHIEDGVIIENSYTEGKKELINIGLKGNYQLACFPDCMVAYEYLSDDELNQGVTLDEVTFHFYDWKYNDLGSVKINYKFRQEILNAGLICGETPERIMLTDDYDFAPRYYINKSDLGTGNIEIHPLNMPEDFPVYEKEED